MILQISAIVWMSEKIRINMESIVSIKYLAYVFPTMGLVLRNYSEIIEWHTLIAPMWHFLCLAPKSSEPDLACSVKTRRGRPR